MAKLFRTDIPSNRFYGDLASTAGSSYSGQPSSYDDILQTLGKFSSEFTSHTFFIYSSHLSYGMRLATCEDIIRGE